MAGLAERSPDGRDIVSDGARRVDMHKQHRLVGMGGIPGQRLRDPGRIHIRRLAEIQNVAAEAHCLRHAGPAMRKPSGGKHQNAVAAAVGVGQRRLPRAMAIGDIDCDIALGSSDPLQIRDDSRHHVHKLALVDIGSGTMHAAQHAVGHDRRAGNGQMAAAMGKGHRDAPENIMA